MEKVAELTGWCAAHAMQIVSETGKLVPFLVMKKADGPRQFVQLVESSTQMFEDVVRLLNEMSAPDMRAVMAYDGFLQVEDHKTNAIILDGYRLAQPRQSLKLAIAYAAEAEGRNKFAGASPRVIEQVATDISINTIAENFTSGQATHSFFAKAADPATRKRRV